MLSNNNYQRLFHFLSFLSLLLDRMPGWVLHVEERSPKGSLLLVHLESSVAVLGHRVQVLQLLLYTKLDEAL